LDSKSSRKPVEAELNLPTVLVSFLSFNPEDGGIPPERRALLGLHGVASQKTVHFVVMGASDPAHAFPQFFKE
jgi:hypothetical protein